MPRLLSVLGIGVLVDQLDRRRLLHLANFGRATTFAALTVLVATNLTSMAILYVVYAGLGIPQEIVRVTEQPLGVLDLPDHRDGLLERVDGAAVGGAHGDEHEGFGVEVRAIAADRAGLSKDAQPAAARRDAQSDPFGEFSDRQPPTRSSTCRSGRVPGGSCGPARR